MKLGIAPIWKNGSKVELHHLIQKEPGSMVEVPKHYNKNTSKYYMDWLKTGGVLGVILL